MFKRMVCVIISVLMLLSMLSGFAFSVYAESTGTATTDEATKDEAYLLISDKEVENGSVIGIMGDADGNDKINIKDATVIQKYVANLILLSQKQVALADADNSAKINVKDATSIQKFLAGYEVKSVIKNTLYEVGTHIHSYSEVSIGANCIRNGYTLVSCVCGEEYKENETPATGHNYTDRIVNATCTEDGYIEFKCENCSYRYTEIYGEKTGHVNTELRNRIYPTTTSTGYTGDTYCIDCNVLLSKGETIAKLPSTPSNSGLSDVEQLVFDEINAERKKAGLKPVKWDSEIYYAANIRANEFCVWCLDGAVEGLGHIRPNGEGWDDVLSEKGLYYTYCGEILVASSYTDDIVLSWMNSSEHRKIILSGNYTHASVCVIKISTTYYACAIFRADKLVW
ncbi:MAG: hypothetical protein IKK10_04680 [Clostridia bacterium]|nr:hypothetical protein [Clostridia bacterium]